MPYFDTLTTCRQKAGIRISELAARVGIDRTTIKRAEKHYNCRWETLAKIINGLNELHYTKNGGELDPSRVITENSRFGKGRHETDLEFVTNVHQKETMQ